IDPEAEDKDSAPKVRFLRGHLRAAATEVNSPSTEASKATFLAVQDLVTELVKIYRADKNTTKREAKYAKHLNTQRAEVLAPKIKEVDDLIKALELKKARLVEKLNGHNAA
ncbi:hypothetical protein ACFVG4_26720, partial [Streptomyces chartreusis]